MSLHRASRSTAPAGEFWKLPVARGEDRGTRRCGTGTTRALRMSVRPWAVERPRSGKAWQCPPRTRRHCCDRSAIPPDPGPAYFQGHCHLSLGVGPAHCGAVSTGGTGWRSRGAKPPMAVEQGWGEAEVEGPSTRRGKTGSAASARASRCIPCESGTSIVLGPAPCPQGCLHPCLLGPL